MRASGDSGLALKRVYAATERYYGRKLEKHGPTPRGVDWSCVATQELRFVQLLKICGKARRFSLNDVGCGYGALLDYIRKRRANALVNYLGLDVTPAMIAQAKELHRDRQNTNFIVARSSPRTADYSIASGIFNVKLDLPFGAWESFVAVTLRSMHATSLKGFAVNFMTPLRGGDASGPLYRTSPEPWAAYCTAELGAEVEIVSDYGLREFTMLVRPEPSIA
jgi:SAM-dependent methyltransferase